MTHAVEDSGELVFNRGKKELGRIPIDSITSVIVDDKSRIEKRITATRVLALGLFSLAFQKKNKHKEFALVIEHETGAVAFEFTGGMAQMRANIANSELQKILKNRE